jgi:hypothetical protein
MKRAALYCRVSTVDQHPETQLLDLRQFAAQRGLQTVETYTDHGVSGTNPPLPDDHIGYLPRLHASAEEALEDLGVESIRDIPDDFELSEIQRRAATSVQTGEPWYSPELRQVLDGLAYPLHLVDFETVNWAVPPFAGMRPYDQLPFQWSVHVQRQPGTEPEHHEFLATDASDPRREFISSQTTRRSFISNSSSRNTLKSQPKPTRLTTTKLMGSFFRATQQKCATWMGLS